MKSKFKKQLKKNKNIKKLYQGISFLFPNNKYLYYVSDKEYKSNDSSIDINTNDYTSYTSIENNTSDYTAHSSIDKNTSFYELCKNKMSKKKLSFSRILSNTYSLINRSVSINNPDLDSEYSIVSCYNENPIAENIFYKFLFQFHKKRGMEFESSYEEFKKMFGEVKNSKDNTFYKINGLLGEYMAYCTEGII